MGAWESFWRSVRRNFRSLWRVLVGPNAWQLAEEANAGRGRAIALGEQAVDRVVELEADLEVAHAERDAAVAVLKTLREGIRQALISAGYFRPDDDLVSDVKHMASEYVQTVAQLRLLKEQSATDRRNCVDMSDRLAAAHREKDDLERQIAEREGRAAKPTVITGEGLSTWTPR